MADQRNLEERQELRRWLDHGDEKARRYHVPEVRLHRDRGRRAHVFLRFT